MHSFLDSGDLARAFIAIHEQAAESVAEIRPNVVAFSLYQETDGVLFNGTSTAVQWLTEHGFNAFQVGTNT
jgi:hypothetical protein